jgi:hypothetical protein
MTAQPDNETRERQMTEVRALRMLRAGDSAKDITAATGLTMAELDKLKRDFPGGPPPATVMTTGGILPRPGPMTLTVPVPSPIARLLEDASAHSIAKVRTLGAKIETQLDQLRALIADHQETERAKQRAAAEKAKAQADIQRLEAELAAAKARLRGKPTPPSSVTAPVAPSEGVTCRNGCGKTFGHAGARGNHERFCTVGPDVAP